MAMALAVAVLRLPFPSRLDSGMGGSPQSLSSGAEHVSMTRAPRHLTDLLTPIRHCFLWFLASTMDRPMSSVHLSDSELGGPFFFLPLLAMGPGSFEHAPPSEVQSRITVRRTSSGLVWFRPRVTLTANYGVKQI